MLQKIQISTTPMFTPQAEKKDISNDDKQFSSQELNRQDLHYMHTQECMHAHSTSVNWNNLRMGGGGGGVRICW